MGMVSESTERNVKMNDTIQHGSAGKSVYLALILGGIALLFYIVAWLKFWH